MKTIIKNTPVDVDEVNRFRKRGTEEEIPLMTAKYNAQVSRLLDELYVIRNETDDVDEKVDMLIEIMIRGIEFKD
jgi:hypothetical protein